MFYMSKYMQNYLFSNPENSYLCALYASRQLRIVLFTDIWISSQAAVTEVVVAPS